MNSRNAVYINCIFFFAIAISLMAIHHFFKGPSLLPPANNQSADAYLVNAFFLKTDDLGQQEIAMFSPLVKHYPQEDSTWIEKPNIQLFKNGQCWLITANQARGCHGAETFFLENNVLARQLSSIKTTSTTLSTSSLTVFPKKDLVMTNKFVTIEQPGLKISGKGLIGSLKDGSIQLLSNTKGHYDPSQAK